MAAFFSYAFDRSRGTKFLSFRDEQGVEITLVHELTWTSYGKTALDVTLHRPSAEGPSLVVAEVWVGSEFCDKKVSRAVNDAADFRFPSVDFTKGDAWTCIVRVMPLLELRNVEDWAKAPESKMASPVGEEAASLEQLSEDWQQILLSGDLSDVVLASGAVRIPAHKVVLAARSPVFARMFQNDMKENSENLVSINDVAHEVLRALVGFMYTGAIKIDSVDLARSLYVAADKYAVQELKALCSGYMLKNLTCVNVLETLAMVDLHGDVCLKQSCLDFVARCYSEVRNAQQWESFSRENKDLAIEILSYVLDKKM